MMKMKTKMGLEMARTENGRPALVAVPFEEPQQVVAHEDIQINRNLSKG